MENGTIEAIRHFIDVYGLHNAALFKELRRDRLTDREKREKKKNGPTFYAFSKQGFRFDRVEWETLDWTGALACPEVSAERLRIRNDRGDVYRDNIEAFHIVVSLLNVFDDIKPFAHYAVRSGACRIEETYNLNLAPMLNYDASGTTLARDLLGCAFWERPYESLSAEYIRLAREIFLEDADGAGALLGAHVLAVLRHWTGYAWADLAPGVAPGIVGPHNLIGFTQAAKRILELLYKRFPEIRNEGKRRKTREILSDLLTLYLRMSVLALLDGGYGRGACRLAPDEAMCLLSDEILGVVASRMHEVFSKFPDRSWLEGLEGYRIARRALTEPDTYFLRYRFYKKRFLFLGDEYGDCTASEPSKQVDIDIRNIHWTVYPWMLNPYYRVLEVCRKDGKGLIKAHITPLVIDGRRVLMVDAIESIPALRREAVHASAFNEAFFNEHAEEAFVILMERCVRLGREMGFDAVYADMFSNAVWIRKLLEKNYPHDSYHVANVEIPFSSEEVEDNICLIKENSGLSAASSRTKMEIQAINCGLMNQQALRDHKIVAVLYGLKTTWSRKIRAF